MQSLFFHYIYQDSLIMMTDINGALFPLSKNPVGTVKDPTWMVSQLIFALDLVTFVLLTLMSRFRYVPHDQSFLFSKFKSICGVIHNTVICSGWLLTYMNDNAGTIFDMLIIMPDRNLCSQGNFFMWTFIQRGYIKVAILLIMTEAKCRNSITFSRVDLCLLIIYANSWP